MISDFSHISEPTCPIRERGINSPAWVRVAKLVIAVLIVLNADFALANEITSKAEAEVGSGANSSPLPWEVTFEFDVMAVLSRTGCNQGTCHGNQNGKGGFFLSLRGEDPAHDYRSLTQEYGGRRIDWFAPENSLLLTKATASHSHRGGKRFDRDSLEYEVLSEWIRNGAKRESQPVKLEQLEIHPAESFIAPGSTLQLQVLARFSNGEQRDVTSLAVFTSSNPAIEVSDAGEVQSDEIGETNIIVRYLERQKPVEVAIVAPRSKLAADSQLTESEFDRRLEQMIETAPTEIDRHINAKLERLNILPSEVCSDLEFMRRSYLDLLGRLPSRVESEQFLYDKSELKREELIDRLLSQPEFASFWAIKWSDLLRNEEKVLDTNGVKLFHEWITTSIQNGKPLNEFARELIASRGSTYEKPASNYYRALRDPMTRGEATARLFQGVRLGCAKCHNHPFEKWTQKDYYDWAAIFSKVDYEIIKNERRDDLDKNEFNGEQIVKIVEEGEVKNPRTSKPAEPRFLGVNEVIEEGGESQDRLIQLADWIASSDNRRFAEVQANLIWYHLMGRGLVDPIDDFRITNQPTNPQVLAYLADRLVDSNYDLRTIIREIMQSETYQRSSVPTSFNNHDELNYSHNLVRRLTAEQLLDVQNQVLGTRASFQNYKEINSAVAFPGAQVPRRPAEGDLFLKQFGKPTRLLGCECERTNDTTLTQAFELISGTSLDRRISDANNDLSQWLSEERPVDEIVVELFWRCLSRTPTDVEISGAIALIEQAGDPKAGIQDVAWALLNSKEFIFRR